MSDDTQSLVLRVLELEAENRTLKANLQYKTTEARRWREWYDELKAGTMKPAAVDDRFTFGT